MSTLSNDNTLSNILQELQAVWNYDWSSRVDSVTDLFLKFRHLISGADFISQCYKRIWKSKRQGSAELHAEQEEAVCCFLGKQRRQAGCCKQFSSLQSGRISCSFRFSSSDSSSDWYHFCPFSHRTEQGFLFYLQKSLEEMYWWYLLLR